MAILITGSNGYLGNVLNQKIREGNLGAEIIPVDLGIFQSKVFPYNKADLRNAEFPFLFPPNVDTVIHLAGVSNDPSCELDYRITQEMNVEMSKRLIDFASISKVKRFIFASSASVYGANPYPVTEDAETNPQSEYARSKIEIEKYLLEHKEINPIIFRFGTLFGVSPKMRYDLAVNLMTKDAILTGEVNVSGGGQSRPFLNVEDAAFALLNSVFSKSTGIFNLAVSNTQIIYLAEAIAGMLNAKINVSAGSLDPRDYKMDCYKIRKELNIIPNVSIANGIDQIARYIKSNLTLDFDNTDFYTIKAWKKFLESK